MKRESRFIRNAQIIIRKEEKGSYLYDPDSGNLEYINKIGTSLYELCDGLHPMEEMIGWITSSYQSVPLEQIDDDVERFLLELLQRDLIKRVT